MMSIMAILDRENCQLDVFPDDDEGPDIDPDNLPENLVEIGDPDLIAAWLRKESTLDEDEDIQVGVLQ